MKCPGSKTLLVLCCVGVVFAEDRRGPFFSEPDLKGTSFVPPQPFLLEKASILNTGLADWSIIEDWPVEIKSIRIVEIAGGEKRDRFDWATNERITLELIAEALSPTRMQRYALSDFSKGRGTLFGGDLGVVVIELSDRKLIIGFGESCFYFGVAHGDGLQSFHSWLLAKILDDSFRKQRGKGLDADVFANLSGEHNLIEQRDAYEAVCRRRDEK